MAGSAAHNIRLYNNDEFDVLLELRSFPNHKRINQVRNRSRPGYVFLDLSGVCTEDAVGLELVNNPKGYLDRSCLMKWMHHLFHAIMNKYGICFTIHAKSLSRHFSIDFMPAVKIERAKSSTWYAIPKVKSGPGNMANFTFLISDVQSELELINRCGFSMKTALRLLQVLHTSKNLKKLSCYHMITVAIWLHRNLGHHTVNPMSITDALFVLLTDLCDAFKKKHLGYVWNAKLNILDNFTPTEMSHYASELSGVYKTLKVYHRNESTLNFSRYSYSYI
ncbi:hypothetical protein KR093_004430, partial [Drosophila rubida]